MLSGRNVYSDFSLLMGVYTIAADLFPAYLDIVRHSVDCLVLQAEAWLG